MTTTQAIEILRQHNQWRRGSDDVPPTDPTLLGNAIDVVCIWEKLIVAAPFLQDACHHVINRYGHHADEGCNCEDCEFLRPITNAIKIANT
jgi:hypothetical protein